MGLTTGRLRRTAMSSRTWLGRVRAREPGVRNQRMRRQPGEGPGRAAATRPRRPTPRTRHCRRPPTRPRCRRAVRAHLFERFTGDFDQMATRRIVRVGTTFNRTFYFVDNGVQRGAAYELGQAFEEQLNKKLKTTNATKISVAFVPTPTRPAGPGADGGQGRLRGGPGHHPAGAAGDRGLHQSLPHQRQRGGRDRPGRTGDRLGRRPVREGRPRPQGQQRLAEPGRAEREPEGEGPASGGDPGSPGEPRGRRPARDGQRRAHPDGGRPGLPGGVLEEGLHEPHGPRHGESAHRGQPRGGHPEEQPASRGRAERVPGEERPRERRSAT